MGVKVNEEFDDFPPKQYNFEISVEQINDKKGYD